MEPLLRPVMSPRAWLVVQGFKHMQSCRYQPDGGYVLTKRFAQTANGYGLQGYWCSGIPPGALQVSLLGVLQASSLHRIADRAGNDASIYISIYLSSVACSQMVGGVSHL
jgi:hypothetical protein